MNICVYHMINIYMQKNINKNDFKYSKNIIKMILYYHMDNMMIKQRKLK